MTLKKKFLILLAFTLFTTVLISFFAYKELRNNILSTTGSLFLKKQLQFERERVLNPVIRELVLAQKMASSTLLKNWMKNENDKSLKKEGIEELESFRRFFSDQSYFLAIKSSGNYYFNDSSNSFEGKQLRYVLDPDDVEHRWFFATLESGDDYRLNVDHDEKLGVTKVWINIVVKDNGVPLGIAGTGIELTEFIKKVIENTQEGLSNILIEDDGAIQAHTKLDEIDYRSISKSLSERKTIFSIFGKKSDQAAISQAMKKANGSPQESFVFFGEIEGRNHLIGVSYIKEINWYNVSILDIEKVIGKDQFYPFAGLLIFALLIFACMIYFLLNRFALTRIEQLDNSVRGFSKGVLPDYPESSVSDEIGNLEQGFRKMAKVVTANTEDLELKVIERTSELELKNKDLEKAMDEIKALTGLLPICAHCKNIRDDKGYWHQVEEYVSEHTNAKFSHGICPVCIKKHYPQYGETEKTDKIDKTD